MINPRSRQVFLEIIDRMGAAGAQEVVAGTEMDLLVARTTSAVTWFPTPACMPSPP